MANYRVTIHSVTSWEEGNEATADWSHGMPRSEIAAATAKELADKVESEKWNNRMKRQKKLPFVYEDEAEDEDEAKSFALQDLYETLCRGDYYEPTDCDCTVEELDNEEEEE